MPSYVNGKGRTTLNSTPSPQSHGQKKATLKARKTWLTTSSSDSFFLLYWCTRHYLRIPTRPSLQTCFDRWGNTIDRHKQFLAGETRSTGSVVSVVTHPCLALWTQRPVPGWTKSGCRDMELSGKSIDARHNPFCVTPTRLKTPFKVCCIATKQARSPQINWLCTLAILKSTLWMWRQLSQLTKVYTPTCARKISRSCWLSGSLIQ